MEKVSGSAPGKVILFGEHAVVYGRPAIAVPVTNISAQSSVQAKTGGLTIHAVDLDRTINVNIAEPSDPLEISVLKILKYLKNEQNFGLSIKLSSSIPIGGGFGSSAAISTALIRSLAAFFATPISDDQVNQLAFEIEGMYHGTPSGVDNTVIVYNQPLYFVRNVTMNHFSVGKPMHLVIADTGILASTHETVSDVRAGWHQDPSRHEALFDDIGSTVDAAHQAIAEGDLVEVGRLMDENHTRLQELDVSSMALDRIVFAARGAGALGAKLSGGGRGGNVVILTMPWARDDVVAAVTKAGAIGILETVLE